jgi:flagellar basal-body rod protein FlgB
MRTKAQAVIEKDETTTMRVDHNNVDIDVEMANMAKNQLYYNAMATQLGGFVTKMKNVITSGQS